MLVAAVAEPMQAVRLVQVVLEAVVMEVQVETGRLALSI